MRKIIYIIIAFTLFLNCDNVEENMNFTFNNKTNVEVDSIQVIIYSGCLQCPQIGATGKIRPGEIVKLAIVPYDDIGSEGAVGLMLFYDSLKKEMEGIGYFWGGVNSSQFNDNKLKFSIIESDTGLIIINDNKGVY